MALSPTTALWQACRPLILADSGFALIAADRLHDRVPAGRDNPAYPFAGLGPMRMTREVVGVWANGWRVTMRLYTASKDYGRDEAWRLAETMSRILEGTRPELADAYQLDRDLEIAMIGDAIDAGHPRAVFMDVDAHVYPAACGCP